MNPTLLRYLAATATALWLHAVPNPATAASFRDLAPVADAQVAEGSPTSNFGNGTGANASIWLSQGVGAARRGWFRYALADRLPPGATLTRATVRVYAFFTDFTGDMVVQALGHGDDSWSETGITWNTQPGAGVIDGSFVTAVGTGGASSTVSFGRGQRYRWFELDVTQFVQQQLAGDGVATLVLKPQDEAGAARLFKVDSREYHTNFVPRLRLEYTGGAWNAADAVTVLHVNDIHSRLTTHDLDFPDADGEAPAFEEAGGAAYLSTRLIDLKTATPGALVLDAGDISEGNPLGDLRTNGGMVDFQKKLDEQLKLALGNSSGRGLDAIVVGNHDVRDSEMLSNMAASGLPYVSVNLLVNGAAVPAPAPQPAANYFKPYVIVSTTSAAGTPTRVAVLGYTTDDSAILSAETEPLVDVVETRWSDSSAATIDLKDWVEYLRRPQAQGGEGADIVVLLSHIGHRRLNATDEILLGDHGDVAPPDLVVSGHWHTMTATAWQPSNLNGRTTNVEAASYAQFVGEVQLTSKGRYLSAVKHPVRPAAITPNAAVATLVDDLVAEYDALLDPLKACVLPTGVTGRSNPLSPCPLFHVVGHSATDLRLDKDKWFTMSEFPWSGDNAAGEWIADATVWKLNAAGLTGPGGLPVTLALQSGGGVRRDVKAGPVTYLDIYETYPWPDDQVRIVEMSSKDIWDYLESHYVGSSISQGWQVTADDGQISAITYNGTPLVATDTTTKWAVAISEYMFTNDDWISESGTPYDFAGKPNVATTQQIRNAVVEYTSQFTAANPMTVSGPRYVLNTELAGGFKAVVTMLADAENEPYFEAAFVRLVEALPETVARRASYGLASLVNPDGSINRSHPFAETMWYRSHLGFPDGRLKVGDIVHVWGEGGFFAGNPQLVEQEGVVADNEEFVILGNDPALAAPEFFPSSAGFMDEAHENRLVKFRATRTGDNTVQDADGVTLTLYKEGGFYEQDLLPGVNGDTLELVGIQTQRNAERRFRLREASVASGFPPSSAVTAVTGTLVAGQVLTLTAVASDLNGYNTGGSGLCGGNRIAFTSFEEPAVANGGSFTDPNTATHALANLAGQNTVAYAAGSTAPGLELGFAATFTANPTGTPAGDSVGLSDGDFVGVQTFTGTVGSYTDGSKGYEISDADGMVTVSLDAVSLAGHPVAGVCVDVFLPDTTWEIGAPTTPDDRLRVWLETNTGTLDLVHSNGADIDALSVGGQPIEGAWRTLSADLSGRSSATLKFELKSNAAAEQLFVDNVRFIDAVPGSGGGGGPNPGTVTQVQFYFSTDNGATWQSAGVDTNGADGWSVAFTPPSGGTYLFHSVATDSTGLVEPAPVLPDQSVVVQAAQQLGQTIDFAPLPDRTLGDAPFELGATASSGLPVSFSSSTPSFCTVAGTTVSLLAPGICTIAADQAGDAGYLAAPTVVRSFAVNPAATPEEPSHNDAPLPWWALALLGAALGARLLRRRAAP